VEPRPSLIAFGSFLSFRWACDDQRRREGSRAAGAREFNERLGGVVGGPLRGYEDVPSSMTTVAEDARRSDPAGRSHPEFEGMS